MISWTSYLSSILDVVVIGIIALTALVFAIWSRRSQRQDRTLREFAANENGVSYSLGLAIVTPIYTLIMCVIIECALIMVVKIGTVHAAYAAARSAMVWMPAEVSWSKRKGIIKNAAVQAMTPFANSREDIGRAAGINSQSDPTGNRNYYEAYQAFFNPDNSGFLAQRTFGKNSREYVYRKREYAQKATKVEIKLEPYAHTAEVTARVAYEMPINTPGAGRVLGRIASFGGNVFTREIASSVTLDLAMSTAKDRRIGIGYRPEGSSVGGSLDFYRPERPQPSGGGAPLDPYGDKTDEDLAQGRPFGPITPIPDPISSKPGREPGQPEVTIGPLTEYQDCLKTRAEAITLIKKLLKKYGNDIVRAENEVTQLRRQSQQDSDNKVYIYAAYWLKGYGIQSMAGQPIAQIFGLYIPGKLIGLDKIIQAGDPQFKYKPSPFDLNTWVFYDAGTKKKFPSASSICGTRTKPDPIPNRPMFPMTLTPLDIAPLLFTGGPFLL